MNWLLIALYPEAWRKRYAEEIAALLHDDPPGVRGRLDLVRGAFRAHLTPIAGLSSTVRASNTLTACLACFIGFCLVGAGFAKATEDEVFVRAADAHPLLNDAHQAVVAGALAGLLLLAIAALPLGGLTVARVARTRDRRLLGLMTIPLAAVGTLAVCVGLLAVWLDHHRGGAGAGGWSLFGLCVAVTLTAAVACWAAPRAILRRLAPPIGALRPSLLATAALSAAMIATTAAVGVYLVAMLADAPALASSANGPLALASTTELIGAQLAPMVLLSVLATTSVRRGLRACEPQGVAQA
ncbi:MAG TPA: hypothetical protein VHZ75_00890 [Solirubrobacteraceae bacterium]|jgi:hypothetical protein|nr:hypothetical protein [Solirubrobacteraceae bacterium]